MNRQEFLDELRIALQGQVNQQVIHENISYYESYIMQESRKGQSEEEIIRQLGNPRLLAKTIIETNERNSGSRYQTYQSANSREESRSRYEEDEPRTRGFSIETKNKFWVWTTIIAFIVILIGIIALIAGVISILAPILVPILIVLLAFRLFSRR